MNILKPKESKKVGAMSSIVLWLIMVLSCEKEHIPFSGKHYNYHQEEKKAIDKKEEPTQTDRQQAEWDKWIYTFSEYLENNSFPIILRDSAFWAKNWAGEKTIYRNYKVVKNDSEKMKDFQIVKALVDSSDLSPGIKRLAPYIPRQENAYNNEWEENYVQARWLRQFIPAAAKTYGLKIDKETEEDERLDTEKTTKAAIRSILSDYDAIKSNSYYQEVIKKYDIEDSIFLDLATINAHNTGIGNITLFLKNCLENDIIKNEIKKRDKSTPGRLFLYMTQWYGLNKAYGEFKRKQIDNTDFDSSKPESDNNQRYREDSRRYGQESSEYVRHIIKYYILDHTTLPDSEEEFYALLDDKVTSSEIPADIIGERVKHTNSNTLKIIGIITMSLLWVLAMSGAYRRKKKVKRDFNRDEDRKEIIKEGFFKMPWDWIHHIQDRWNQLDIKIKKAIMIISIGMAIATSYGIYHHITNKDYWIEQKEKPKFPNRKNEMGLDSFVIYKTGQKSIADPYYEQHKDNIQLANNISQAEKIDDLIHLRREEVEQYYKVDDMVAESNYKAEHIITSKQKIDDKEAENYIYTAHGKYLKSINSEQWTQYIYTHKETRKKLQKLMKEFNQKLQEAWYTKTLWLEINGMYRTISAQQYLLATENTQATQSISTHTTWWAIDFQNYSNKYVKDIRFKLWYKENNIRKEVENQEVIDKSNKILNLIIETWRKNGEVFISPEAWWANHTVFATEWAFDVPHK